jgi:apolipoprotein N-acyltransferase
MLYYLLPILSGILIGTSYIPFPPWAIFFCFVPLWIFWIRFPTYKKVWWSGWICQFLLTLIGFNWVAHTVGEFGHLPLWMALLALLAFCSFASLHIPLAGLLWVYLLKKTRFTPRQAVFFLPALIWLCETYYPMIFDWHFGYTWLWAGFPAFHLGEWIGFKGLSLISIFFNLLFYKALFSIRRRRWTLVGAFGVLFLALNLTGWWLKERLPAYDKMLRPLIVQANIGNLEKQYAQKGLGFRESILERYMALTAEGQAAHPDIDFAVWPETAFPDEFNKPGFYSRYVLMLRSFLDRSQLHLATGSYGITPDTRQATNSLFFLNPRSQGEEPPPYTKTMLLAFGEYIPGSIWFPVLKKWLPEVADFARGEGPTVKNYLGFKIGPQICYEGLFDWFSRQLAEKGAQVILNVTNDSWYGTWQEPYQHLYMTLSRAVEIRRPLIRSTNTGISTVILADGRILEKSPMESAWQGAYEIPYWSEGPSTFFTRGGYWLPLIFALGWLAFWWIRIKRESKT